MMCRDGTMGCGCDGDTIHQLLWALMTVWFLAWLLVSALIYLEAQRRSKWEAVDELAFDVLRSFWIVTAGISLSTFLDLTVSEVVLDHGLLSSSKWLFTGFGILAFGMLRLSRAFGHPHGPQSRIRRTHG